MHSNSAASEWYLCCHWQEQMVANLIQRLASYGHNQQDRLLGTMAYIYFLFVYSKYE